MNPQRFRRSLLHIPVLLIVPALLAACGGADGTAGEPQVSSSQDATNLPPRGTAWVIFGADTVVAEVADTPALRERGLMFRTELPDGTGMLFVFEDSQIRSFWMRNTYIPLDIAFMNPAMRVVDIRQMEPESEVLTESAAPAMFALEVRQGWFEQQGIETGAQAHIVFGRR